MILLLWPPKLARIAFSTVSLALLPDGSKVHGDGRVVVGADGTGGGLVALAEEGEGRLDADEGHDAVVGDALGPDFGRVLDAGFEGAVGDVGGEEDDFVALEGGLV